MRKCAKSQFGAFWRFLAILPKVWNCKLFPLNQPKFRQIIYCLVCRHPPLAGTPPNRDPSRFAHKIAHNFCVREISRKKNCSNFFWRAHVCKIIREAKINLEKIYATKVVELFRVWKKKISVSRISSGLCSCIRNKKNKKDKPNDEQRLTKIKWNV